MTNFLGYRCPACGDADSIDVAATVWVRLTDDGTDADAPKNGDHNYDPTSRAACVACGYVGKLADFEPESSDDFLNAAQAALDYLTDHAIDLEGEEEALLAGIRADLHDAIAKAKGGVK